MFVRRIKNIAQAIFNKMKDKKAGVLGDKIFLEINLCDKKPWLPGDSWS